MGERGALSARAACAISLRAGRKSAKGKRLCEAGIARGAMRGNGGAEAMRRMQERGVLRTALGVACGILLARALNAALFIGGVLVLTMCGGN